MSHDSNLARLQELIESAESQIKTAKKIIQEITGETSPTNLSKAKEGISPSSPMMEVDEEGKIIEGSFNGQSMTDSSGKEYPVPANYASKSKLIPGDVLKLTIKENGTFVYKQIGPVPRKRVMGTLTYEDGQYKVIANSKAYSVLLASVTYFKGEIGDKVTLIIPDLEESEWGAIENIIPDTGEIEMEE